MTDLGERIRRHYGVIYILVLLDAMILYVVLSLGVRPVWADVAPSQCGCSSTAVLFLSEVLPVCLWHKRAGCQNGIGFALYDDSCLWWKATAEAF